MIEAYLEVLKLAYYELPFAFEGLADENVWKRPAEGLLSVGELAGHIAYWEAVRYAGEGEDLANCRVISPLVHRHFRYYPETLASSPSEQHRAMTAEQVCKELMRVHEESMAHLQALNPEPATPLPGLPNWTYGESLKYSVFHVSYHTGQIYSARHLLGETTPDN